MDKEYVDKIITEYIKKIYGFALSKTMNIDEAEELASRITFEVYKSLLKSIDISNVSSYIYRIARNVYSRYLSELRSENTFYKEPLLKNETFIDRENEFTRLRKEIAYLSKTQREIVVMYYFEKLKIEEIEKRLKIPYGTVSWHLSEARNQIRESFIEAKDEEHFVKNKLFTRVRFIGDFCFLGVDRSYFFSKSLTQNILYTAYFQPKKATDIAKELSIPTAFIEGELALLIEKGFMCSLPGNKYQTNIFITELNKITEQKLNTLFYKYAKKINELYIPLLFKTMKRQETRDRRQETVANALVCYGCGQHSGQHKCVSTGGQHSGQHKCVPTGGQHKCVPTESPCKGGQKIYFPQNDKNFLMWTIITNACIRKLQLFDNKENKDKFKIKRRDGFNNITTVLIDKEQNNDKKPDKEEGTFEVRTGPADKYNFAMWQMSTRFDNRDITHTAAYSISYYFYILHDYMSGKLKNDMSKIDEFVMLYDKGYIANQKGKEYVNMVVTSLTEDEFYEILPNVPEKLKALGKKLDNEVFKLIKANYQPFMQDLCRIMYQNSLSSNKMLDCVLNLLLEKGVLKPLKEIQKKTVNMIMFTDVLKMGKR